MFDVFDLFIKVLKRFLNRICFLYLMEEKFKHLLEKQQYGVIGNHSACKICTWTKKSLRNEGVCYKEKFYGIRCHLCCQMTPCFSCTNQCIFCWRDMSSHTCVKMENPIDDPDEIINGCIDKQKFLLSGFGGNDKVNMDKLKDSSDPQHFAISLNGEPTLYPKLGELIKKLHSFGKTSFLVTNGMFPEKIKDLKELPTQLYVSVDAPNEELFNKIDKPLLKDGWQRLMKTLDLLKTFKEKTRTTLRFTLLKEYNMCNAKEWAELIERAAATFVEVKAYMWVGSSRERLEIDNMPRHSEVKEFAEEICKHCGYKIIDEQEDSRVVLLMKEDFDSRIMKWG